MQQKGDLERYLRGPNSLDSCIEIESLDAQDNLFNEELEMRRTKFGNDGRWAVLGVDYEGGKVKFAEVSFYAAHFTTAQQAALEFQAFALAEKGLSAYFPQLGDENDYLTASGYDETFIRKAVQCINGFLR